MVSKKEISQTVINIFCFGRIHVPFPRLLRMRKGFGHAHFGMPVEHRSNTHFSNPWAQYIFPLVCVAFNFFHQHLIDLRVQIFYLLRFIPRYFIPFDAIANAIVFLTSISASLLVYSNATDICVLILFSATYRIYYNSFLVASLGFSIYIIVSSAKMRVLLPFQFKFLSFPFLD